MRNALKTNLNISFTALAIMFAMVALLFAPSSARADISVRAEVSQRLVTIGSSVGFSLNIQGTNERINQRDLQIPNPSFEGFEVDSASPTNFTQQKWINGEVTEIHRLTWRLTATQEGVAKIGAMEITYGSRKFKTPEIEVKVLRDQSQAAQGQSGSAEPGMSGILPAQTEYDNLTQQLKGRLFARMTISNPNPYIQEAVLVSCKIYIDPPIARQITNVEWNPPAWVDFFAQKLKQQERLDVKTETFNDKQYSVVTVMQFVLAPTRSGKIQIPLNMAEAAIHVRTSPQFEDQFFNDNFGSVFDRTAVAKLPIAPMTLDVNPLPEGRPASFQNAVGNFSFAASVDRHEMTQDDLLTLRLEVGGEGYLGSVIQPSLPPMSEWTSAGVQSKIDGADELKSFRGKKVFEILLRPEKTGILTIPPISYAFFEPTERKYIEKKSEPFMIRVDKGKEQRLLVSSSSPSTGSSERSPLFFGEQLAYIHTNHFDSMPDEAIYDKPLFLAFQTLPLALIGLALGVRARRKYVTSHLDALQYRSAGSRARRELREAQAALHTNDASVFHAKLAEALRTYLATKLRRSASGLTLEEIESACLERGADQAHTGAIRRILEVCDQARYLGTTAGDAESMRATLDESEKVLQYLDKHLA